MDRAVTAWLADTRLPAASAAAIADSLRKTRFTLYGSLLLLPPSAALPAPLPERRALAAQVAAHKRVTHIAVTRPIPPTDSADVLLSLSSAGGDAVAAAADADAAVDVAAPSSPRANVLRAPLLFEPVYGDFGPDSLLPAGGDAGDAGDAGGSSSRPTLAAAASPSSPSPPSPPAHASTPAFAPISAPSPAAAAASQPNPTPADFAAAYWATVKQNGVQQVWAPRWTMFSRGNVREKARVQHLPSVAAAVDAGCSDGRGCAAVDLYVGIGYFAFSYLAAGVDVVLGWDLNAWSLEGLRRGAEKNGWRARVFGAEEVAGGREVVMGEEKDQEENAGRKEGGRRLEKKKKKVRLVAMQESNEFAARRVERWRESRGGWLPPVRHVNCGLLPTSRASWETAVAVLDPLRGGWVHVHENFAVAEIDARAEQVRVAFERIVRTFRARDRSREVMQDGDVVEGEEDTEDGETVVVLEHVNRLKSYAPGVMHCVLDLHVSPPLADAA